MSQTALDYAEPSQRALLVEGIRPVLPLIRNTPYGKRIQNKLQREHNDAYGGGGGYHHNQQALVNMALGNQGMGMGPAPGPGSGPASGAGMMGPPGQGAGGGGPVGMPGGSMIQPGMRGVQGRRTAMFGGRGRGNGPPMWDGMNQNMQDRPW